MGTSRRATIKVGAVALAALFGTVSPGLNPAAFAAQSSVDDAGSRPDWAPPPPEGTKPNDTGKPPEDYKAREKCITGQATKKFEPEKRQVKEIPWGQQYLQLDKVHDYVRNASEHGKIGVVEHSGRPIKVAVIDTGVTEHQYLKGRLKGAGDYVRGSDAKKDNETQDLGRNGMSDCDGHGTQVAGIIAAKPDNPDIGFIGMAPDAEIISIRQSSGNYGPKTADEKAQEAEEKRRKEEEKRQRAREKAQAAKEKREREEELKKSEDARKKLDAEREKYEKRREELEKKDKKGGGDSTSSDDTGPAQEDGKKGDEEGENNRSLDGHSGAGNVSTLAQAVVRAVDNDAQVINISIDNCRSVPPDENGSPLYQQRSKDEMQLQAALKYAVDRGAIPVVSAGNSDEEGPCQQNSLPPRPPEGQEAEGSPPFSMSPADAPQTIVIPPWFEPDGTMLAVGAIDDKGNAADFSMTGPWISVAAPGNQITSLDPAPVPGEVEGGNLLSTTTFDGGEPTETRGTSFAAPYVSGLAVLVRQMYPNMSARDVIQRIKDTAQHPGADGGRDQFVGNGVIDPMAALTAPVPKNMGLEPDKADPTPSGMVYDDGDKTPVTVATVGTAGAVTGLGITLFAVHAIRRSRRDNGPASAN